MGPVASVAALRSAVRALLVVLEPDARVLVACSGGADSLALAAAVAFEAPRAGVRAGLITVDHGLQPGSAERAVQVATIGAELGLDPVEIVPVEVGRHGGPEAAARTARYAALDAAAEAFDALVLLGHTLDDQAETVLLGLGRGSGPRSIAGMPAADGRYRRPLLGVRRATTSAACAALGLPVWDDPHNADPAFQRARLRHEVLPLLDDVLHGGVAQALARTATLLRDDLDAVDALDAWATDALRCALRPAVLGDQSIDGVDMRPHRYCDHRESVEPEPESAELDVTELAVLPVAVRTRVLRAWAATHDVVSLTAERTGALDALITDWHGQGPIQLPGGATVRRRSGRLMLTAADAPEAAESPQPQT